MKTNNDEKMWICCNSDDLFVLICICLLDFSLFVVVPDNGPSSKHQWFSCWYLGEQGWRETIMVTVIQWVVGGRLCDLRRDIAFCGTD